MWSPDRKTDSLEKTLILEKIEGKWRRRQLRIREQVQGDSEGQRSLECCSPWGSQESDTTY